MKTCLTTKVESTITLQEGKLVVTASSSSDGAWIPLLALIIGCALTHGGPNGAIMGSLRSSRVTLASMAKSTPALLRLLIELYYI